MLFVAFLIIVLLPCVENGSISTATDFVIPFRFHCSPPAMKKQYHRRINIRRRFSEPACRELPDGISDELVSGGLVPLEGGKT
ncbi:MAG: hypothetical protein IKT12_00535, partial [Thermoguttaceae bacterium]|nr:hypothetical protein [Thermoguttaceae bacterium]